MCIYFGMSSKPPNIYIYIYVNCRTSAKPSETHESPVELALDRSVREIRTELRDECQAL